MNDYRRDLLLRRYNNISEQILEEPNIDSSMIGKVVAISYYMGFKMEGCKDNILSADLRLLPFPYLVKSVDWSFDNVRTEWWTFKKTNDGVIE